MKALIVLALAVALSGCASLWYAGESDYSVTLPDGVKVDVHSGKQEASAKASFTKSANGYTLTLQETGVQAFQGQSISAGAAAQAASDATAAAIQALKTFK